MLYCDISAPDEESLFLIVGYEEELSLSFSFENWLVADFLTFGILNPFFLVPVFPLTNPTLLSGGELIEIVEEGISCNWSS